VPAGSVLNRFKPNQKYFKRIQNSTNFECTKRYLPVLQKSEIKYGWKELDMGKTFVYRHSLSFSMDFELKIRELL
jgi:hypothetical protein